MNRLSSLPAPAHRRRQALRLWFDWWRYRLARELHDPLHVWLDREGQRLVSTTMRRERGEC